MSTSSPAPAAGGSPSPAAPPSQLQLDAETAALVAAGCDGWLVCWSKRLARRYWYKKPTRTDKEITQWEPPQRRPANTADGSAKEEETKEPTAAAADDSRQRPSRKEKADGDEPPAKRLRAERDAASASLSSPAAAATAALSSTSSVAVSRLLAPAVTAFSNQSRFDAVMALAHRVIAINVLGSTSAADLLPFLRSALPDSPPLPLPSPPVLSYSEDNPRTITLRRDRFLQLTAALSALCTQAGLASSPPPNLFQRWGFSQRALRLEKDGDAGGDPLLVETAEVDDALVQELVREGLSEEKSVWVAQQLAAQVRDAAQQLSSSRQRWKDSPYIADSIRLLRSASAPHSVSLQFVDAGQLRYSIPINTTHWDKLQALYTKHTGSPFVTPAAGSAASPSSAAFASPTQPYSDQFLHRCFALAARYDTISGAGYQAAMPEPGFDLLVQRFSTDTECFASPFNCYLPRFHSAFPDTDRFFGSLGSFYSLRAESGAFESNPPFLELNLACNALHLLLLLDRAQAAAQSMQVVVVWPGWDDTPGYVLLMTSRLMRRHVVLGKGEHTYKEGYQHRARRVYRESGAVSFVFFMQTDAAMQQCPITDELILEFRKRFQHSDQPTSEQKQQRRPQR